MDAMIVVDMQVGLLAGPPKHDLQGVIGRINRLAAALRARSGKVIWIQHSRDGEFARGQPGWALLPEMDRKPADIAIEKTLNDPFARTNLQGILRELNAARVLVAGWATDFCVDAAVRSTISNGYSVAAVSDAHTLSDRPHLDASEVIRHHNWVWANLISDRAIQVASTAELLDSLDAAN